MKFAEGASVDVQVELVDFEASPPVQILEPGEKLVKARKFKDDGNKLYKKGMFPLAKSKYSKAINCVGKGFEFSDEDIDEVIDVVCGAGLARKIARMRPLAVLKG